MKIEYTSAFSLNHGGRPGVAMTQFSIAILFGSVSFLAQATENPWITMTQRDLQAIHDIMQESHPGPVDPENSRYAQWLKNGLTLAKGRAESAASFSDYARALRFYTNGFQDGHIGIGLEVQSDEIAWPATASVETMNGSCRKSTGPAGP